MLHGEAQRNVRVGADGRDHAFEDKEPTAPVNADQARRREVKLARRRAGLSQRELAARLETSQAWVARLEQGQTLPTIKTFSRIANVTGSKFVVRLEPE